MVTVRQVAEMTGAVVTGQEEKELSGIKHYRYAGKKDLSFASSEEEMEKALRGDAECIMTQFEPKENSSKTILKVDNLKKALTISYNTLLKRTYEKSSIHPSAVIAEDAQIADDVHIGANAVVEEKAVISAGARIEAGCFIGKNVFIGANTVLFPNVTVYENCRLGENVIVHSSSVIGADGFGYVTEDGRILKVPQLSSVDIKDNVEIGASTCIDRGTFTDTVIGKNTKIDNLVQIAHNVKIGKNVLIAGLVGVAGSARIEDNVMLGGQSGVTDHGYVPENVKIGAKSGVSGKLHPNEAYLGYPIRPVKEAFKLHGMLSLLLRNSEKLKKLISNLPKE